MTEPAVTQEDVLRSLRPLKAEAVRLASALERATRSSTSGVDGRLLDQLAQLESLAGAAGRRGRGRERTRGSSSSRTERRPSIMDADTPPRLDSLLALASLAAATRMLVAAPAIEEALGMARQADEASQELTQSLIDRFGDVTLGNKQPSSLIGSRHLPSAADKMSLLSSLVAGQAGLPLPSSGSDRGEPHILDVRIYSYAALTTVVTALQGLGATGLGMVVQIARTVERSVKAEFLAETGDTLDDRDPGLVMAAWASCCWWPEPAGFSSRPLFNGEGALLHTYQADRRGDATRPRQLREWPVAIPGGRVVMAIEGDRRPPPSLRDIGD